MPPLDIQLLKTFLKKASANTYASTGVDGEKFETDDFKKLSYKEGDLDPEDPNWSGLKTNRYRLLYTAEE